MLEHGRGLAALETEKASDPLCVVAVAAEQASHEYALEVVGTELELLGFRLKNRTLLSLDRAFANAMPVTHASFIAKFKYVREARNMPFHHREVPQQAMVMSVAEELLDMIDVHLGAAVEHVQHYTPKRVKSVVQQTPRHRTLEPNHAVFQIAYSFAGGAYEQITLQSHCSGSAMSPFIRSLDSEKLRKLSEMKAIGGKDS